MNSTTDNAAAPDPSAIESVSTAEVCWVSECGDKTIKYEVKDSRTYVLAFRTFEGGRWQVVESWVGDSSQPVLVTHPFAAACVVEARRLINELRQERRDKQKDVLDNFAEGW